MTPDFAEFDGPRRVRPDEWIASLKLWRICFGGTELEKEAETLAKYVPPKRGGTYILAHAGQTVSQIGTFHDRLKLYDGEIRAGSVGGVCTHPEYRGKGLASQLFEYCAQELVAEGARLLLISGDEGVYTRLGSVPHGRFINFSITAGQSVQWRPTPTDLVVRKAILADAAACAKLCQAEPVHFIRENSDFSKVLHDPMRNPYIHSEQWIIEQAGQAVAYLFLGFMWGLAGGLEAGIRHVGDYAGSRLALVEALKVIMTREHLKEFSWQVSWQDVDLIQLLQESGLKGTEAPLDGHTLRILNFSRFMADLRPMLRARLDANLLRGLRFEQSGPILGGLGVDRYTITRGTDRLELDGASMTSLIMGRTQNETEPINLSGALAEIIPALFPLPSFLPGLNYH